MKNEIINKEYYLNELKPNKSIKENENKNNDISTTKEDESFIADEPIQYCSSPRRGLVSINISNNINDNFTQIPTEKNRITNTVTMRIAIIKKEINLKDSDMVIKRRSTYCKLEESENESNRNRDNRCKSNFKEKKHEFHILKSEKTKNFSNFPITEVNRIKLSSMNVQINKMPISKKTSKSKKKKKYRKSQEKYEDNKNKEKGEDKRRLSLGEENEHKKKKKKKKKNKKKNSKKKVKDDINDDKREEENDKEREKEGHTPNIIILDFTSSENNDGDSDDTEKNNKSEKLAESFREKEKNNNNNENFKQKFDSLENGFFRKRQKTIISKHPLRISSNKNELLFEKKIVTPKAKQSCYVRSPYKICQTKIKPNHRKHTTDSVTDVNKAKIKIKSKSICPVTNKKSGNKHINKEKNNDKDNKVKENERERKNSCALLKIFNNNKNLHNKNHEEEKPIKIRHSISKNYSIGQQYDKLKNKIKNKDSIQSCKMLNKKYENITNHNLEKEKHNKTKGEEEKDKNKEKKFIKSKEKIDFRNKSNKNLEIKNLNKTPNSKIERKNAYNSNRNLTKITINPKMSENKDIHLVFDGKQETIINYTNQEMVDDENEYMVECLKVLLKLNMEEQPRCKQKVNFNFPEEQKNKKIALFDLDETLVHCTKEKKGLNGDIVNIKLPTNKTVPVGLNIRSHWKEALDLIKSHYHIVVYTASHQSYADAVLNYLDKENKYFQYRLYRNHCVQCDVDGIKFYVKDLDTLNKYYNLKDVVLIDNSVLSFAYHLNNGIPIVPFIEQKDDTQLLMLAYYLVSISSFDDLTQENKKHINIEHFLSMAKKLAEEEDEEEDEQEEKKDEAIDKEKKETSIEVINEEKEDNNMTIINTNTNDIKNGNKKDTKNDEKSDSKKDSKNGNNLIKEKSVKSVDKFRVESRKGFLSFKKSNKLLIKRSEKALKIAKDMKKSLGEVYKTNFN